MLVILKAMSGLTPKKARAFGIMASWFQSWMLGTISYRGTEQTVDRLRSASTADKNRTPAPEALAARRALLAGRLMWSEGRGYTIVEIMVVLAISGIIFISGFALFNGQGAETNFNQAMSDLSSKLSTEAKSVSASQFYGAQGYDCKASGSPPRATLSASGGSSGAANQDCLSIGKAFEAITGSRDIFIYNVLGNRLFYSGATSLGPASSLAEANPTIATVDGADLTTDYKLAGGVKIISSQITNLAGTQSSSSLVGYYLDFNGETSGSQNGAVLTAKAYNLSAGGHDVSAAKACVEGSGCPVPTDISAWQLCLESSDAKRRALLVVNSSAAGVTTTLKFESCS